MPKIVEISPREKELSALADKRTLDLKDLRPKLSKEDSQKVEDINFLYTEERSEIVEKHNKIDNEKASKAEKAKKDKVKSDEKKSDSDAKEKKKANEKKNTEAELIAERKKEEKKAKDSLK